MKMKLELAVVIVLFYINSVSCALSRPQRQTILNVVNNLRRRVAIGDFSEFPPSANMRVLEWDDRLEAQSRLQNGQIRCGAEQVTSLSKTMPFAPYPLIGYVVTLGIGKSVNMSTLQNKWLSERKHYFYNKTWDCANLSCKNFLQLVWAETAFVGCSHNENCDNGRLVCYFAEGSPRRIRMLPYKEGVPCSQCSSGLPYCMARSLCASQSASENTHSQCDCDITASTCVHGVVSEGKCECICEKGWGGAKCNIPCKDRRVDCNIFKEQGACRWDALEWRNMESDCRETCGHCNGTVRIDKFHTNLEQILPNAGFPLFRSRPPALRPHPRLYKAPTMAKQNNRRPYYQYATTRRRTPKPRPTTTTTTAATQDDFASDIPWTKEFHDVDGYGQLGGNCRGSLLPEQSCVYCTLRDCATACTRTLSCVGFSYILDENRCLMKGKDCLAPEASQRVHYYGKLAFGAMPVSHDDNKADNAMAEVAPSAAIKMEILSSVDPKIFPNIQGYGLLEGNCPGAVVPDGGCSDCTVDYCSLLCSATARCAGFSFVSQTRLCYLKWQTCERPFPNEFTKFYKKLADQPSFKLIEGYTLLTGYCDGSVPNATTHCQPCGIDECKERCNSRSDCAGFTYYINSEKCDLLSAACRDHITSDTQRVYVRMKDPNPAITTTLKTLMPSTEVTTTTGSTTVSQSTAASSSSTTTARATTPISGPSTTAAWFKPLDGYKQLAGNCFGSVLDEQGCDGCAIEECALRCSLLPGCSGFTYVLATRQCLPKSETCYSPAPADDVKFYVKEELITTTMQPETTTLPTWAPNPDTTTQEPWTPEEIFTTSLFNETTTLSAPATFSEVPGYRLLPGNCYGNILSEGGCVDCSALECARRCDSLPGCGGFTYIPYQLRRCIPKSGTCSNPTVNEQIRFYERDSIVPTLSPMARSRGRHMPRSMSSRKRRPSDSRKHSAVFFDYHPSERRRNSLFGRPARHRGDSRSGHDELYPHRFPNPHRPYFSHEHFHSHSHEGDEDYEDLYGPTTEVTTPAPTPPPPISDFAPPGLIDCRFSSVQLPQLSCQACSVDDCAANCRSSQNCVGFTYVVPEKTCLPVATKCSTPSPDANIVFYPRLGAPTTTETARPTQPGLTTWFPTPRGYQELPGQNCWSGTIPHGECMPCSSEQCAETCTNMDDCVGFTYILAQQHCLPKSQACNLDTSEDVNMRFYQRGDGPPIITTSPATTTETIQTSELPLTSTVSPVDPDIPYNPQADPDALLTTRQICYNTVAQLSCGGPFGSRSDEVVKIVQAHFGRISYPNEMTCGQQNPVDPGAIEVDCGFFDVKPFVSALCNDKTNCSVFASNNILGNCQKLNADCPLRSMYLEVTFMCVAKTDQCSVISSEIPAGLTYAASSSARMGAPAKPRSTCPGTFGASCDPSHALFTSSAMQAWCPSECDKNDGFIQLDLGAPYQVSALVLQGRRRWDHWISRYYVTYSANGHTWQQLEDQPATPSMVDGNWDARSVVIRRFPSPSPLLAVRYLRLHIANYVGYPAVHVDVVRCPEVVGCTPLTVAHSNATGVFAVYGQSVVVQCDRRFVTPVSRLSTFSAACLPNGEWSRTEQCLLATNCGDFPRVDNALHDGQSAEIGRRLMYTCNPGYRMVGNPMVTCQPSGLWSDLPNCAPSNAIV